MPVMVTTNRLALGFAQVLLAVAPSFAQPPTDAPEATPQPVLDAASIAERGAFLPFSASARHMAPNAFAHVQGGFDGVRDVATFDAVLEARVFGPLSLRASVAAFSDRAEGRADPSFALKVDALDQRHHGVDVAVYAGYQARGFNGEAAANVLAAVGRSFGRTTLLANVGYGQALGEERHGEARLAALTRVGRGLHVGVDSRAAVDLERDVDEPAGEPDYELSAGPAASWSLGRFAVTAGAGATALRLRGAAATNVGFLARLGAGAAF